MREVEGTEGLRGKSKMSGEANGLLNSSAFKEHAWKSIPSARLAD